MFQKHAFLPKYSEMQYGKHHDSIMSLLGVVKYVQQYVIYVQKYTSTQKQRLNGPNRIENQIFYNTVYHCKYIIQSWIHYIRIYQGAVRKMQSRCNEYRTRVVLS